MENRPMYVDGCMVSDTGDYPDCPYAAITPGATHPDVFERLLTHVADVRDRIKLREIREKLDLFGLADVFVRKMEPRVKDALAEHLELEAAHGALITDLAAYLRENGAPVTKLAENVTKTSDVTKTSKGGRPRKDATLSPAERVKAHRSRKAKGES